MLDVSNLPHIWCFFDKILYSTCLYVTLSSGVFHTELKWVRCSFYRHWITAFISYWSICSDRLRDRRKLKWWDRINSDCNRVFALSNFHWIYPYNFWGPWGSVWNLRRKMQISANLHWGYTENVDTETDAKVTEKRENRELQFLNCYFSLSVAHFPVESSLFPFPSCRHFQYIILNVREIWSRKFTATNTDTPKIRKFSDIWKLGNLREIW